MLFQMSEMEFSWDQRLVTASPICNQQGTARPSVRK